MIERNGAGLALLLREYVLRNWFAIIAIVSVAGAMRVFADYLLGFQSNVFSASAGAMLATVVGIFLVFRFDNAYQRWWEARKLWGQMVNSSRTFARQVLVMLVDTRVVSGLTEAELQAIRKRLVYRHIAYVNALRLQLREQQDFELLGTFLDPDELEAIRSSDNVARDLSLRQGREIAELFGTEASQTILLAQLDGTLTVITDVQGGCERIKNTVFPDMVSYISKYFVWGIALLIPALFLEPGEDIYPLELVAVVFMAMAFIIVQQLALSLMNPFVNKKNDTPMSALCVTIERDLRQMLGETDLPEPVQPVRGVLM